MKLHRKNVLFNSMKSLKNKFVLFSFTINGIIQYNSNAYERVEKVHLPGGDRIPHPSVFTAALNVDLLRLDDFFLPR